MRTKPYPAPASSKAGIVAVKSSQQTTKKGTIRFYAMPMVGNRIQIERWANIAGTPGRVLDQLVEHAQATGFSPRQR